MITHGRGYLFGIDNELDQIKIHQQMQRVILMSEKLTLHDVRWSKFKVKDVLK